ncbi:unnamed protein product [Allacma fusca]|uniref:Uncharacterized protein n=1 Tax=Allacma fusca TaxID=39272 RepID=A0A8J2JKQ3_9HEXA|nr:unnamed protein product [Allacma fusca]
MVILLSFLSNGLNGQPYGGQQQNSDFQNPLQQNLPPNQDGFPVVKPEWQAPWPNPRQMQDLKNAVVLALLDRVAREVYPGFPPQVENYIATHSYETPQSEFEPGSQPGFPEGAENPQDLNYGIPSGYVDVPGQGPGPRPPSSIYGTYSDHGPMQGEFYPEAENEDHPYNQFNHVDGSNQHKVIEPDEYTAERLEGHDKSETDDKNSIGHPTINTVFLIATVLQSAWFVHKAIFE